MERDKKIAFFKKLTVAAVQEWAGATVAQRGQTYQRGGRVRNLALASDGRLVAWVEGRARYATLIDADEHGLIASCTCPYGATCKHAVAVILAYLEQVQRHRELPAAPDVDPRLLLLEGAGEHEDWDDVEHGEEDPDEDAWDEEDRTSVATSNAQRNEPLRAFLERQTKTQLVELLEDLARRSPEARDALEARRKLATGTTAQLVHDIRKEIAAASVRPGWRDSWRGEGYTPDYSRVRDRLELLLRQGQADEVVALSETLLEAGVTQVEESQDEGETAGEIASCVRVVFRALSQSSLGPSEQILWAIDREVEDQYDLCAGSDAFWEASRPPETWSIVATTLIERLQQTPVVNRNAAYVRAYFRDRLVERAITALRNAGREDEVIPLCEREAELTGRYDRLVKLLLGAGRPADAEAAILKGLRAAGHAQLGGGWQLRATLRELREQAGDWAYVAAMGAEDFFDQPSILALQALRSASERIGVWQAVRERVMHYLESGQRPDLQPAGTRDDVAPAWPLPTTGLPRPEQRPAMHFPLINMLIELAIDEGRPDDVLRWYDHRPAGQTARLNFDPGRIADAIADAYPDRAVAMWKQLVEAQIAQTNVHGYEAAVGQLRKLKRVLERQGRVEEWQRFVAGLRQANARKRRLVELLDGLTR